MLQEEDTDLLTGMKLISSAAECVRSLRKEDEFCMLWDTVTAKTADTPAIPAKWSRQLMSVYVVEETTGVNSNDKTELRRLYFSALDHVLGEMETCFSKRNSKLAAALATLDPESETFLNVESMKPIMDLTNWTIMETECIVAKQYISRIKTEESQQKMTVMRLLSEQHKVLEASVLSALKVAVTFGASAAMCENSFSALKNIFTDHRRAMSHTRKSQLVHLAFERDLMKIFPSATSRGGPSAYTGMVCSRV
ncbi:zinc finger MYM-type protein 1-like [Tachysurus ichikawai]